MKKFFQDIGASFYSSDFYQKAKDTSALKSIKFVVRVTLLAGLCVGIILLIIFLVFAPRLKKLAVNFVGNSYPADLVVTVKDGLLTANTTNPVFVPIVKEKKDDATPKNLIVLAPSETAEVSVLTKYNTISAITSNGIVVEKGGKVGEISIYQYGKNINKVFTKDSTVGELSNILHFLKIFFAIGIIPILVLTFLLISFFRMVAMFFYALLVWVVLKLGKLDISYKQSYQMGLPMLAPLLILNVILFPLNLNGMIFSLFVILAITLIATRTWGNTEEPKSAVDTEIIDEGK